jgi:ABC-type transport system substrate-binding protein
MIDGVDVGVAEYNPDKAREIMKSLGYGPDNKLVVELMSSSTQAFQAMTEAIQGMANECYFDVKVSITASGAVTEDSYTREFPSKWDGIMAGYQQVVDAEIFFRDMDAYQKQPGEFSAHMGVDDPEFSRLFKLLPVTEDQTERNKIIDQLNILFQEKLYYIPLIINYQPIICQNYLQNIVYRDGMGIVWKSLEYKDWVNYKP